MLPKLTLNNTDLVVSALCYGTNALGTAYDQAASSALLDHFAALGGNFIDTARSYGDWVPGIPVGASERAIGTWLKGKNRADFVIATKGGMVDMRKGDWRPRVTPEDIASDLAESLEHLGVASIDLYWLHSDNPQVPVGPVIDALIAHQKAGKIRYFGASNWSPARIEEAQAYAASVGHKGFAAIQPFWGLAVPNPEGAAAAGYGFYYADGLQKLHASGLTIIPYSGQSRGFFSKLADGEDGIRDDVKAMFLNNTNRARFVVVQKLAAQHGVSINEVVLAYLTSQPLQTIPIIGAFRVDQLEETVKAVALKLTADELKSLEVTA
jgi:aryl-alcohol dehydrogenase-like predicted oxidoreductase